MNYFEHHIGDYDKNTSHLTACEDGMYHRLIRRYYDKEAPLPADVDQVKRLARARDKLERTAVDTVLNEFFTLEADGWHHKTCDEVIAAYQSGEPEREAKKKNEDTRLERHRRERAELFAVINAAGQHLPYNASIADVRALATKIRRAAETPLETPAETPAETGGTAVAAATPATAPATPATATQTPDTNPHPPDTTPQGIEDSVPDGTGGRPPAAPPTLSPAPPYRGPKTPAEEEKSRLWAALKVSLVEQKTCIDHKAAGVLLGKYASKYGHDVFLVAARQTVAASPVDANTYLVGLCETAAGKRQRLNGHLSEAERLAANAAANAEAERLLFGNPKPAGQEAIDA